MGSEEDFATLAFEALLPSALHAIQKEAMHFSFQLKSVLKETVQLKRKSCGRGRLG